MCAHDPDLMHDGYRVARRKLRDIRRIIRKPLTSADVRSITQLWNVALEKEPCGRQGVLFVEDLIEQNTSLRW